ncbi:MAG: SdpI family protein [Desulfobacterales bacterium]|nr:SdpI family protein [Desulfobacterales bacterium]
MDNQSLFLSIGNILTGILIIGICIPLLKGKIKMNKWYGMRFKKSFESEENWYKINTYGAKRMIIWSSVLVMIGIINLWLPISGRNGLILLFGFAPLVILIPIIECYLFMKNL